MIPETLGVQVITGTTTGLMANYRAGCDITDPARNRADAVYVLTLTAERNVTLVLAGASGNLDYDTSLHVRTTCENPASEVACSDDNDVVFRHGSLISRVFSPGTYYVFVDGSEDMLPGTTHSGAYNLQVVLGAPFSDRGVSLSVGSGVPCGALPGGGVERLMFNIPGSGPAFDDAQSRAVGIGFRFTLLGAAFDYFSANINGYLQLLPTAVVVPIAGDTSAFNSAIPNTGAPNALVAPFWDDLILRGAGVSRVETWQDGPGDNRVRHVRWTSMARYADPTGMPSNLSFEARLFESHRIEMHYCNIDGPRPPRAQGDSATIGLESSDGSVGIPISFNTRFVSTGMLIGLDQR